MDTPSARIVAAALEPLRVEDAAGRRLTLKRMGALDRLLLFKALGPELSLNTAYLGMALLAASVTEVDGIPVPWPTNETQVETLVQRLGNAGLAAAAGGLGGAGECESGNLAGTPI